MAIQSALKAFFAPHSELPKKLRPVLLCLGLWVGILFAGPGDGFFYFDDTKAGTSVLPFLKIPVGARASAMGSFDGPANSEPMMVFWNPAWIPQMEGFQTQFSHSEYLGEWRHEAVSTVFRAPLIGNLGIGFNGLFATPFEASRDIEEKTQTITAMDYALGVAWGVPIWEQRLYLGAKINWLHSQLDEVTGDGYGLDVAGSWALPWGMRGSAVMQNLAHAFSYRSGTGATEKLPSMLRLGVGFADTTSAWAWQLGYSKSNDAFQRAHAGGEWNWNGMLFLRGGYEWDFHDPELGWDRGIGGGVGLRLSTLGLDYSLRSLGTIGLIHTITFQVHPPLHYREVKDYLTLARKAWEKGTCKDATRYAEAALRENPSELDAVAIIQACEKEARVAKAEYIAIAYTGNTEGQAIPFWEGPRQLGGLSRRKALLDRIRMQYPALRVLDAGRVFSRDSLHGNDSRIVDLYGMLPVDQVLETKQDAELVKKGGWKDRLSWFGVSSTTKPWSILKVNHREFATFGFSGVGINGMKNEIEKARKIWERPPALQVVLLDGTEAQAIELANTVSGIDMILISGEQALLPKPLQVHRTWISCPGRRGEAIGLAVVWYDEGIEPRFEFRMMPVDETQRPDTVFAEILGEDWRGDVGENTEVINQAMYEDYLFLQAVADGRQDIWLADTKQGKPIRLTRTPAQILSAGMAWSRNRMFFLVDSSQGKTGLFLQDLEKKTPIAIGDSLFGEVTHAAWEPYENWLYLIRQDDPTHAELYRTTWAGTHFTNLSRGEFGLITGFDFAPSGRAMVIETEQNGKRGVFHVGMTLAHKELISPDSVEAKMARFNPSGVLVAYLSRPVGSSENRWNLMQWDSRDDRLTVLAKEREIHDFAWSHDGSKLFLEVGVNRRSIQVLDLETLQETPLRSSFEAVQEEFRPRAHRRNGVDGVLFESNADNRHQILWTSLSQESTPLELVPSSSTVTLP